MSKRAKTPRGRASNGEKREKIRDVYVGRPFEGLADEPEWIALRELVPAAAAPLKLSPAYVERYGDRPVTLATVLPMAWPAMTKPDGRVFIGLQRHVQSGDISRDLAVALQCALETPPGQSVAVPALPGVGDRLQDVIENAPLDITVHTGFEFWLDENAIDDPAVRASLERANASIFPTVKLAAAPATYWCRVTDRSHVRLVLGDNEDRALDALSRLAAGGGLLLGEQTKFAGMFRAHGLLAPVWDLPLEVEAEEWEVPVAGFAKRYAEAFAVTEPLTAAERRSKQGLIGRLQPLR
ncbi:topoisomerase II [Dactylosporangium roseum]|uniref:Topoisomerase II n=1 Tax=Dactylosporangium roseum TaxID=47989 RepID=A0ABY5Z3R3_9ACTN|nr:DUF5926 family protein [Dactylosporangium roseum]UWZ36670.1 topoisomerase II [Dactylosporangium roseum]